MSRIRVGIETRLMAGNLTGIGNYSFHLLSALIYRFAELEFLGFQRATWSTFDENSIREIEHNQGKAGSRPTSRPARLDAVRKALASTTVVRTTYRKAYQMAFSRSVAGCRLDLFHALNFIPPTDPGVPVLPVIYDLSVVRYPQAHPKERLQWLEPIEALVKSSHIIQTISEFSRNEITQVFGVTRSKIFVAPPAPSPIFRPRGHDYTASQLQSYDLEVSGYFLAVGTLEPRKNLRTLISAYGALSRPERADAPLVVVGGAGWGHIDLPAEAASLIQEGSLRFLGAIPDIDLSSLYEGAIALLYPSVYEGFGMPVVEAMSCGTKVIHSSATAMDEITAGLGIRVPALDVDLWRASMRHAIDCRTEFYDRSALVSRARTFSWQCSAARVRDAYTRLLA